MANEKNKALSLASIIRTLNATSDLEEVAFALVKDGDGINRDQWVQELIDDFPQEVMAVFDCDPVEATPMLEKMWDTERYTDPATDFTMTWPEWSAMFNNGLAVRVYDQLRYEYKTRRHYEDEAAHLQCKIGDIRKLLE